MQPRQNALRHPAIWSIIMIYFDAAETKVIASEIMPYFLEMPVATVAFALTIVRYVQAYASSRPY